MAARPLRRIWRSWLISVATVSVIRVGPATAQHPEADASSAVARKVQPLPTSAVVRSRVDDYVRPLVAMRDFSGTVLVVRRGRVLLSRGYGFADLVTHVRPTATTRCGIGSISKTITAAAI